MMKVGLVNLYGNSVLSISSENGDRDICCKALLIASLLEAWGVTRSSRLWNIGRFRGGPLDLSLCGRDSFLLCLQRGEETVLSLWGRDCLFSGTQCDRETTLSLWGGDFLLSHSLCCSPMLCSSFHEWLDAGLGPFRRKSSSSLLACYCRANTYCFNISISLSLLDWDGTVVVVDLSSYKWDTGSLLWTCEGCTWFSLWTLNRNHLSSWTDSLEMLGWERSAGPFLIDLPYYPKKKISTFDPTAWWSFPTNNTNYGGRNNKKGLAPFKKNFYLDIQLAQFIYLMYKVKSPQWEIQITNLWKQDCINLISNNLYTIFSWY